MYRQLQYIRTPACKMRYITLTLSLHFLIWKYLSLSFLLPTYALILFRVFFWLHLCLFPGVNKFSIFTFLVLSFLYLPSGIPCFWYHLAVHKSISFLILFIFSTLFNYYFYIIIFFTFFLMQSSPVSSTYVVFNTIVNLYVRLLLKV